MSHVHGCYFCPCGQMYQGPADDPVNLCLTCRRLARRKMRVQIRDQKRAEFTARLAKEGKE